MAFNTCDSGQQSEKLTDPARDAKETPLKGFRFWLREYLGVDLRVLALTRILLALIVISQLAIFFTDIEAFFSEKGLLDLNTAYLIGPPLSAFILSDTLLWAKILFTIHFVFAFFLLLGFKTRLSSLIVWFLYLSVISRGWMFVNSGDIILVLMLFWGIFVPWGARFSIDTLSEKKSLLPKKVLSVGTAAFILQMPLVYFFTGLIKSADPSWAENFSAVFYSLAPHYMTYGGQLLLKLDTKVLEALTAAVLALEIYGPIFIFFPFFPLFFKWFKINFLSLARTIFFIAFTLLQLSLYLTLSIGAFPFISIVSLIPILNTSFLDRISSLIKRKKKEVLKVFYDGDCFFCQKAINILYNLGLLSKSVVAKAQENREVFDLMREKNSWVVINKTGDKSFKFEALLFILKENVITKPIYFICKGNLIKNLGNRLYKKVSENRSVSHKILSLFIKGSYPLRMSLLLSLICLVFLTFALYSSLSSAKIIKSSDSLYQLGKMFRMNQHWVMFSRPIVKVGYFETEGVLVDGRLINLSQTGGPIREGLEFDYKFTGAPFGTLTGNKIYENNRWRKYFENLEDHPDPVYLGGYVRYICNAWKKNLPKDPELDTVIINFIGNERDPSYNNGLKGDWEKREVHTQRCEAT